MYMLLVGHVLNVRLFFSCLLLHEMYLILYMLSPTLLAVPSMRVFAMCSHSCARQALWIPCAAA